MLRTVSHLAYFGVIILLVSMIPLATLGEVKAALIVIGAIGVWRYSWAAINFARAGIFLKLIYPMRRAEAHRRDSDLGAPRHAFVMITSYKIDPEVTAEVYRDLFRATARTSAGATVVASIVDPADERLIRRVHAAAPSSERTTLIVDRIPGSGKRDAIARSLEILQSHNPTWHDIVAFVDGDTCVPEDLFDRVGPWFADDDVGALTTDEIAETGTRGLFQDWFDLRFAQRQAMMCSMGISKRVLTLTGRMSVFRAQLATDPSFIEQVRHDEIQHWRLGSVKFLTGDDKSTWFWLLERGYKMLYLPDVAGFSFEGQPKPGFVESAVALMKRWYGNMLRTNARAANVSPRTIGFFTWWSLRDQKYSIWTTLSGPIAVLIATVFFDVYALPAYIAWVLATRYIYCTILAGIRGRSFPINYPILLYFSQIMGAAVKSYVVFRLDRQKWTRQSTGGRERLRTVDLTSIYMHVLSLGWLVFALAIFSFNV